MPKKCWLPSKSDRTRYWTVKVRAASVRMAAGFWPLLVADQVADGCPNHRAASNLGVALPVAFLVERPHIGDGRQ